MNAPAPLDPRAGLEECRDAFENWMSDDGKWPKAIERRKDGGYILAQTASDWRAWVASWFRRPTPEAGDAPAAPHECGWTETAKQFAGGMELYRGLLDECAKHLGEAAYRSDDGSIHDEPVRLNIPALVAKLAQDTRAQQWEQLWGPVTDLLQKHGQKLGIRLGDSISDWVLAMVKGQIAAAEAGDAGPVDLEAIEDTAARTGYIPSAEALSLTAEVRRLRASTPYTPEARDGGAA